MGMGVTYIASGQLTTSDLRTWAQRMHNSILAVGLTDVSASGAISDFSTLTLPPTANSASGYKVYAFADTLQASLPIYFKLEWGTGTVGTSRQSLWLTVGTSHDGAAGVTGSLPYLARIQAPEGNSSANNQQFFTGGSGSYVSVSGPAINLDTYVDGPPSYAFSVERLHNSNGADNANGFIVIVANGATSTQVFAAVPATGSIATSETRLPVVLGANTPSTQNGRPLVSPIFPIPAITPNPALGMLVAMDGNFRDLDIIPVEVYSGITATYIKHTTTFASTPGGVTAAVLLTRWT